MLFQVYNKVILLYIEKYLLFFKFFPYLGKIEQTSLCYTVGPCWLSVIYMCVIV